MSFLNKIAEKMPLCLLANNLMPKGLQKAIKLTEIKIKSEDRSAHIEAELSGESTPLIVDIKKYTIEDGCLMVNKISTNKEWVTAVAQEFLVGKELIDLPSPIDKFFK